MAKLKIDGKAVSMVECDSVSYKFTFLKKGECSSVLAKELDEEMEAFLKAFHELGITPDMFELISTSTSRKSYTASGIPSFLKPTPTEPSGDIIETKREIILRMKENVIMSNTILQVISENNLDVEFNESHYVSNEQEIRKKLLEQAINETKQKAEMIAACAGKKILGISEVNASFGNHRFANVCYGMAFNSGMAKDPRLSDKLSIPKESFSEEVTVIWSIES